MSDLNKICFIWVLSSIFLTKLTAANYSDCTVQMELLPNGFIKLMNGDILCRCLGYENTKYLADSSETEKTTCDVKTSNEKGSLEISADSICGCVGYVKKSEEKLITLSDFVTLSNDLTSTSSASSTAGSSLTTTNSIYKSYIDKSTGHIESVTEPVTRKTKTSSTYDSEETSPYDTTMTEIIHSIKMTNESIKDVESSSKPAYASTTDHDIMVKDSSYNFTMNSLATSRTSSGSKPTKTPYIDSNSTKITEIDKNDETETVRSIKTTISMKDLKGSSNTKYTSITDPNTTVTESFKIETLHFPTTSTIPKDTKLKSTVYAQFTNNSYTNSTEKNAIGLTKSGSELFIRNDNFSLQSVKNGESRFEVRPVFDNNTKMSTLKIRNSEQAITSSDETIGKNGSFSKTTKLFVHTSTNMPEITEDIKTTNKGIDVIESNLTSEYKSTDIISKIINNILNNTHEIKFNEMDTTKTFSFTTTDIRTKNINIENRFKGKEDSESANATDKVNDEIFVEAYFTEVEKNTTPPQLETHIDEEVNGKTTTMPVKYSTKNNISFSSRSREKELPYISIILILATFVIILILVLLFTLYLYLWPSRKGSYSLYPMPQEECIVAMERYNRTDIKGAMQKLLK